LFYPVWNAVLSGIRRRLPSSKLIPKQGSNAIPGFLDGGGGLEMAGAGGGGCNEDAHGRQNNSR
jgi:hypothetical protein